MELLLVVTFFVLLACAAQAWARDTRDDFAESPPSPTIPARRSGIF